nr:hypothetical protein [Tanacetum cinerariifolium]
EFVKEKVACQKKLNSATKVHALETTCFGLREHVSGYERLKEQIEEHGNSRGCKMGFWQRLREVDFLLLAELNSHKDANVEDIMNLLLLESPLTDALGMSGLQPDIEQLRLPLHRSEDQVVLGETSLSFSLSVTHS